ncbi:hypothetical protein AB0C02_18360 [Micromonospora sp. NPDC048999]|uniref:hypothetical protein n=1 Tax=Micromonospora sp. NPDC048999 TaxID=3155391 RepID=UPI0033E97EB8
MGTHEPDHRAGGAQAGEARVGVRGRAWLGVVVLAAGCTTTAPSTTPATTAATGCASRVETGALPDWADAGFSDASAEIPHVLGAKGEIVAVLFAHPLTWKRTDGASNKILWVSRPAPTPSDPTSGWVSRPAPTPSDPTSGWVSRPAPTPSDPTSGWVSRPAPTPSDPTSGTDLSITATLDGVGTRLTREVRGGPGPSIIDLPHAGCWHLDLRWSGRTDAMDLVYADGH